MKSSRIKITALMLTAAFALTGCGEALYELTPEEEDAVVSYASHVIAKFNTYQKDGEIYVSQEVLNGEDKEEETQPPDTQQTMPEEEETEENTQSGGEDAQQSGQDTSGQENTVSIKEALGLDGISTQYGGSSLCEVYDQSDSFAVDAEPGKQLLVLSVKLTNETAGEVSLDILQKKPSFEAVVNGENRVSAQMTILPNDLSTYQGSIPAGESTDTVLIFQIPEEIESVSDVELEITLDGSRYTANL